MADKHTAPGDQQARTGSQQDEEEEGHQATTTPPTHTPDAVRGIIADGAVSVGADGGGKELDARVRRVLPQGVGVRPFTPRVPSQPAITATKMAMLSRTSLTHDNSESGQGRGRFPSPGGVTLYDK